MSVVYLRGEAREEIRVRVRASYEAGYSVRQCMEVTGKSYGATHRLLRESGAALRPRGGERWR